MRALSALRALLGTVLGWNCFCFFLFRARILPTNARIARLGIYIRLSLIEYKPL